MRPTIWLKNNAGEVWNLRPTQPFTEPKSSFLYAIDGTGFETKLTVARVKYDFVVTDEEPKQIDIQGQMYFVSPANMKSFGEFVGDYEQNVRFYYDPEGKIDPHSQMEHPWYKEVRITKLNSGECDKKTGMFVCKMAFTPLSVMWRRDTVIASSTTAVQSNAHVYSFTYPYFYQNEHRLYLAINNTGERIGCKVNITNTGAVSLPKCAWTVTSGNIRQYAQWLENIGLEPHKTLVVDSNPSSQESTVKLNGSAEDVADYQEANPQYINFIELYPGENLIVFDVGTIENVIIEVSYTEQLRVL